MMRETWDNWEREPWEHAYGRIDLVIIPLYHRASPMGGQVFFSRTVDLSH